MIAIETFNESHLEEAANLVITRYKKLCKQEPLLPGRYKEFSNILPLLKNLLKTGSPGIAAIREGQMIGFIMGWLMPDFRGKRSTYSPEWANAAELGISGKIYEEMYRHIAADWVVDKYIAHYLSIFANDLDAIKSFHWLGFGMLGIDALRGLQTINIDEEDIDIQLADSRNLDDILELNEGLRNYMKGSPTFLIPDKLDASFYQAWIEDPKKEIWLAYSNNDPVAFIRIGPANHDVSTIIYDDKTTSIYGAFTKEAMRGKDIATTLLSHALESAQSKGYKRCAVDFETMNLLGTRFWLKNNFNPISYSLVRYIDERLV